MNNEINLLFISTFYSWVLALCVAIAGFSFGFIFKSAVIYKQRKRILNLEDEMLSNHSRILTLEKRIAEQKEKPIVHQDFELIRGKDREVKIS